MTKTNLPPLPLRIPEQNQNAHVPTSPSIVVSEFTFPPAYSSERDDCSSRAREIEHGLDHSLGSGSTWSSTQVQQATAPHTMAMFELQGHIAAIRAMLDVAPGNKKSRSRLTKRRSVHFTLPTSKDIPFTSRTDVSDHSIGEFGESRRSTRSEYTLNLPIAVPLPSSKRKVTKPRDPAAHQYHSTAALECMRKLAIVHPSPNVRQEWALRANAFEASGYNLALLEGVCLVWDDQTTSTAPQKKTKRDNALADVGKGVAILVGAPVVLAVATTASAVAVTGLMMYGSGKFLIGFGRAMTFGKV